MMEIDRMLTISTAHISPKTRALLDEPQDIEVLDKAVVYKKGEYGWFIYPTEHAGTHPLPADLQACIDFTKAHGCSVLCLDRDGYEIPDLPVYDDEEEA